MKEKMDLVKKIEDGELNGVEALVSVAAGAAIGGCAEVVVMKTLSGVITACSVPLGIGMKIGIAAIGVGVGSRVAFDSADMIAGCIVDCKNVWKRVSKFSDSVKEKIKEKNEKTEEENIEDNTIKT